MLKPPLPLDENARLVSLRSLRILDTPNEERFDRITRMAQRVFGVETCLISLLDTNRQWFKSKQGLSTRETAREISFSGHAILEKDVLVVPDALADERFVDNPLVTDDPKIRFYAGCPVHGPDGHSLGTLCLIDPEPRSFSDGDVDTLRDLASMVDDELLVSSQVTVDELTQVANRRGLHLVGKHMLSLCRRSGIDVEVAFFDLDGYEETKAECGHAAGDELLKHFANLLLKCFRTADVVARIGSDEFVVMMANSRDSGPRAAARLDALANDMDSDIKQHLTWSAGFIQLDPERHLTIESLLEDADGRTFENKQELRA